MNDDPNGAGHSEPRLNAELTRFAADLARLRPRDDRLDRERLAFLAGRASAAGRSCDIAVRDRGRLRRFTWPVAFAAMSAVAVSLLIALVSRTQLPQIASEPAFAHQPRQTKQSAGGRPSSTSVLSTRDIQRADLAGRLARMETDALLLHEAPHNTSNQRPPILRTSSWQQALEEGEVISRSRSGASNRTQFQGATSS